MAGLKKERKVTQEDISELLNIWDSVTERWENDMMNPSVKVAKTLITS